MDPRACHWLKEDLWRYCYNSSRTNELVSIAVEWKLALYTAAPQDETTTTEVKNKPVQDKGKRKIVEIVEAEKSYKIREDPLVEKVALEIEVKKSHRERRVEQRKREKERLEDTERKLQETNKRMKVEKELRRREREEN